eukprot:g2396.t1
MGSYIATVAAHIFTFLGAAIEMMTCPGTVRSIVQTLFAYWRCVWYFSVRGGAYEKCPYFAGAGELQAKVQVFSLTLVFKIWDRPHYRNGTFQDDMVKNLRNVAIPGTGVPLSWLARYKFLCYLFLWLGYPFVAFVAAANAYLFHANENQSHNGSGGNPDPRSSDRKLALDAAFRQQLLMPQDWFSFWRLNCRLATYHASTVKSKDYGLEDKWTFLQTAEKKGVSVSPSLDLPGVILKHRNEEGGLGFARYFSPHGGGNWIVQPILRNGPEVSRLLPENAPLSTFRVITASRGGINGSSGSGDSGAGTSSKSKDDPLVRALSVVFRAGLAGAATDHKSILFDVDNTTGRCQRGTTNAHWYRLGWRGLFSPWTSKHDIANHPDTGKRVEGETISSIREIKKIAVDAHAKLCPAVPLVGWDVCLTKDHGMVLLEGNFSCNFFRGKFDLDEYLRFVDDYFKFLENAQGR